MTITFQVLGAAGRDNAVLARVDTGKAVHRLLFDCGEQCLYDLGGSEIQQIDAVFFSHFHFDHIAGFDSFFRVNFRREGPPVHMFGPEGAIEILQHRMLGVSWNLLNGDPGMFHLHEVRAHEILSCELRTADAFAARRPLEVRPFTGLVHEHADYTVSAVRLNHHIASLGYLVGETPRRNIDAAAAAALDLPPGRWMQQLKDPQLPDETPLNLAGQVYALGELRRRLLTTTAGSSLAYLTDFRLDAASAGPLLAMLQGCRILICENNFRNADLARAIDCAHLTSGEVGALAAQVNPEQLILFHLSDRYSRNEWLDQLREVRAVFPRTRFPEHWRLE